VDLRFDWDPLKSNVNRRKHGVSFDEAAEAFSDEHALLLAEPDHSSDEERFVLLGVSSRLRLLVVCHCYRKNDEIVRIISARKANRTEREIYDQRRSRGSLR